MPQPAFSYVDIANSQDAAWGDQHAMVFAEQRSLNATSRAEHLSQHRGRHRMQQASITRLVASCMGGMCTVGGGEADVRLDGGGDSRRPSSHGVTHMAVNPPQAHETGCPQHACAPAGDP